MAVYGEINLHRCTHSLTQADSLKCNAEQNRREDDVEYDGKEEQEKEH